MGKLFNKWIYSELTNEPLKKTVSQRQREKMDKLINNTIEISNRPIGLEKLLRIFLLVTQRISLGHLVKRIGGKYGELTKNIATEYYVLFKLGFSLIILSIQPYSLNLWFHLEYLFCFWAFYSIFETLFYISNLTLNEDLFSKPFSYKRNIIFLIFNYVELNFCFAILYLKFECLRYANNVCGSAISSSLDAFYFSMVTSLTIGFGDMIVVNDWGKVLVISQAIIFLLFGVFFLNFYVAKLGKDKQEKVNGASGSPEKR